jgi:hypothetical protein
LILAAPVAVVEAVVEAPPTSPVPVAFVPVVSLLFKPVGWKRYMILDGSFVKLVVFLRIMDPATIGPTSRARAMISMTKYKTAYRQTRLFLSFDCFIE